MASGCHRGPPRVDPIWALNSPLLGTWQQITGEIKAMTAFRAKSISSRRAQPAALHLRGSEASDPEGRQPPNRCCAVDGRIAIAVGLALDQL
jgi:hypothetical protein